MVFLMLNSKAGPPFDSLRALVVEVYEMLHFLLYIPRRVIKLTKAQVLFEG